MQSLFKMGYLFYISYPFNSSFAFIFLFYTVFNKGS